MKYFAMQGLLRSNMRRNAVGNGSVSGAQAPTPDEDRPMLALIYNIYIYGPGCRRPKELQEKVWVPLLECG